VKKSWKILENRGKSIKKSWKIVVKCSDASTSNHLLACEEIRTYQDNSWEELVKQSVSPMASSWNLLKHVETSGHTHSSQAKFRASTLWRSTSTENVEKMSRCPENDIHVICHVICYDDLWWSAMSRKWSLSLSSIEFSLSSHCVLVDSFDGSLPPGSLPVSSASRSLAANSQLSVIYTMYLLYLAI
jgi:hypothetical protein